MRMAGGLALTVGSTSLLVSLPGCGGDDDGGGGGADGGGGGLPTIRDCEAGGYYTGVAYDDLGFIAYYYYYYGFYCSDPPGDPWLCYDKPLGDYDLFCYAPSYYYLYYY